MDAKEQLGAGRRRRADWCNELGPDVETVEVHTAVAVVLWGQTSYDGKDCPPIRHMEKPPIAGAPDGFGQ